MRLLVAGVVCLVAGLLAALLAPAASLAAVTPTLVVANSDPGTLTSYPLSASGDASPASTVSADGSGSLEEPGEVALDAAGDLWVANFSTDSVVEYTKSQLAAGGAPTPTVTLSADRLNSLDAPNGVAFDAEGDLWVANSGGSTVVEYTKSQLAAGGDPAPAVTLSSDESHSIEAPYSLVFDATGNLWVSNYGANSVVEYSASQLDATDDPTPAVTLGSDASGSLDEPDSLAFDAGGGLWVTNYAANSVVGYSASQLIAGSGSPTPAVTLVSDGSHSLDAPGQAAFDTAGDLWVSNAGADSVVEFTKGQLTATGGPTPADAITGGATGLAFPDGLALEQAPTVSGVSPASGPSAGNSEVTISGAGFYPGSTVDFGTTPAASVSYVSPYELTADSPVGTGTVDVSVSTGEGTSASSAADRFSYTTT
ncbi:MAG: IPT/TIG domain-containing protein, partial [Solirubrobacteraceae bacterium]